MTVKMIMDVLEIYYNETTDYDIIADRCGIDILTVAYIVNGDIV